MREMKVRFNKSLEKHTKGKLDYNSENISTFRYEVSLPQKGDDIFTFSSINSFKKFVEENNKIENRFIHSMVLNLKDNLSKNKIDEDNEFSIKILSTTP